jgi:hypothetical protein
VLKRLLLTLCLLALPVTSYAFPDNGVLDSFGAADNTTPPNANWTNAVIFGGSSASIEAQSGGVTTATSASEADAYYNAATYNADSEVYAKMVDPTATSGFMTVCLRLVQIGANTTDGYCMYVDDAGGTVHLQVLTNGSGSDIASWSQAAGIGDQWGIKAVGSSICGWYKTAAGSWTELGCATDSTHGAGGRIGLSTQWINTAAAIDDFGGGNVTAVTRKPQEAVWFQ